jgi:Fic family protein
MEVINMEQWTPLKYETLKWENKSDLQYLSRSSRSKILSTYESSLPNIIFDKNVVLSSELDAAISDLIINISRFDIIQSQKGFSFPTVLLRSESAASSQIENLTSSIRNIALAELSSKAPQNAQLIARNVAAMRTALKTSESISITTILKIHKELMQLSPTNFAGEFRNQAVWIGGTNYSPHEAIFVPPHHSRLKYYMNDLIAYANRFDVNPIVKAAIIHAQFETIHPFIDGNGRTGRTLIHKSLKDDGVLQTVALPISAGLLNNTNEYMDALLSFQQGDPIPIIKQVLIALELAIVIGDKVSKEISLIIDKWESIINEKITSSIWKLLYILIEQPVVDSAYISNKLDISIRGANKLINRAIDYGVLRRIGNERRGIFYESDKIISVMDKISDLNILRRNSD